MLWWERRSSGMSDLSCLQERKRYKACDDEQSDSAGNPGGRHKENESEEAAINSKGG